MSLADDAQRAGRKGLREAAEKLLRDAKAQAPVGSPVEDPDPTVSLAETGYIREGPRGTLTVGFDAPYAAKQHEAQHFDHPRGGKAKFLEDPLKDLIGGGRFERIVAGEVRARLKAHRSS